MFINPIHPEISIYYAGKKYPIYWAAAEKSDKVWQLVESKHYEIHSSVTSRKNAESFNSFVKNRSSLKEVKNCQ